MTQIQAPDGQVVEFPDDMSHDEILTVMRKHYGGPSSAADTAIDMAKSAAIGVPKGVMGIAGLPGDVSNWMAGRGEWLGDKLGLKPLPEEIKRANEASRPFSSNDIRQGVESVTGPLYEPKTTAGHYAQTVGEFAPAALAGGGGVVGNLMRGAVAPGLASEAVGQYSKGSEAEPWLRGGAALLGGGAASLLARPRNAESILTPAMQGVDRATLDNAQALMADAAGRGINLSWAQAIENAGSGHAPLQRIQRFVERTPQGSPAMSEFYQGQPGAMRAAATNELDNIAPAAADPYVVGPQAAKAATGAIDDVRGAINDYTRNMYRSSALTPVPSANTASPAFQSVYGDILRDDILPHSVPGIGTPNSVASIDMVRQRAREIADNLRTHQGGNSPLKAAIIDNQIGDAVREARANVPAYDQAMALQAFGRGQILEPLTHGPLGGVANSATTEQAAKALMGRNLAGGEDQIRRAVINMDRNTPGTGSALVRQNLDDTYNSAAGNLVSGGNYYGGAKFAKAIAGNPQSEADLSAAVRGSTGGRAADEGMQRLVEILRATGRRLPEGSQTATDLGMADAVKATRGPIEKTLSVVGRPLDAAGRAVDDIYGTWRTNGTARDLARILQDPNEIELLTRAARLRGGNTGAALLANALRELGKKPSADARQ